MMELEKIKTIKGGGGTKLEVARVENERLNCNYEVHKAAEEVGVGFGGATVRIEGSGARNEEAGSEESLEYPPGWGPQIKNKQICADGPSAPLTLGLTQEEKENSEQAHKQLEESPQFPPGWGPSCRASINDYDMGTTQPIPHLIVSVGALEQEEEKRGSSFAKESKPEMMPVQSRLPVGDFEQVVRVGEEERPTDDNSSTGPSKRCSGRALRRIAPKKSNKKSTQKFRKRGDKKQEMADFRAFLRDMHSPIAGGGKSERTAISRLGRANQDNISREKREAVEIVRLSESLGLRPSIPEVVLINKVTDMLGESKEKTNENRRGHESIPQ